MDQSGGEGGELRSHRAEEGQEQEGRSFRLTPCRWSGGGLHCFMGEQGKDHLRKLEEEKENLQTELNSCSSHLDSSLNKYNNSQKVIQELNMEVSRSRAREGDPSSPLCLHWPQAPARLLSFNEWVTEVAADPGIWGGGRGVLR